ncbi:glutathione S-transferase D5-like [Schistocerca nitens]|uniref:glutathione S-transferase D5-like n=1 Tax=Schistocerca nitens TaxID=7011 RepID=UPI0021181FE6|nr:glutathione S-transferase D5-like [Schistocerca nitens]XP_049802878.1 glutathione S-transferase D5-like [Schistocerca nitens]
MAPLILYNHDASPPCCLVRIVADEIGVDLEKVLVVDIEKEMGTPERLQINPQRTIPALVDNGLNIAESRAIVTYLVSKYAKDDSLYPKDLEKRVLVDQRLYFDQDFYNGIMKVIDPTFSGKPLSQSDVDKVNNGLEILNRMLEGKQWLAGDNVTVADYATIVSLATLEFNTKCGINPAKHANIAQWISRVEGSSAKVTENMKVFREAIKMYIEYFKKQMSQK